MVLLVSWLFFIDLNVKTWPIKRLNQLSFVSVGFDCRCGNLFCAIHRYSDKHDCPYDYRGAAAARIRKENPIVVAEKIQKLWGLTAKRAKIVWPASFGTMALNNTVLNWVHVFIVG